MPSVYEELYGMTPAERQRARRGIQDRAQRTVDRLEENLAATLDYDDRPVITRPSGSPFMPTPQTRPGDAPIREEGPSLWERWMATTQEARRLRGREGGFVPVPELDPAPVDSDPLASGSGPLHYYDIGRTPEAPPVTASRRALGVERDYPTGSAAPPQKLPTAPADPRDKTIEEIKRELGFRWGGDGARPGPGEVTLRSTGSRGRGRRIVTRPAGGPRTDVAVDARVMDPDTPLSEMSPAQRDVAIRNLQLRDLEVPNRLPDGSPNTLRKSYKELKGEAAIEAQGRAYAQRYAPMRERSDEAIALSNEHQAAIMGLLEQLEAGQLTEEQFNRRADELSRGHQERMAALGVQVSPF